MNSKTAVLIIGFVIFVVWMIIEIRNAPTIDDEDMKM